MPTSAGEMLMEPPRASPEQGQAALPQHPSAMYRPQPSALQDLMSDAVHAGGLLDDDDDELERLAIQEMEEEDGLADFQRDRPPKPPTREVQRPPSFGAPIAAVDDAERRRRRRRTGRRRRCEAAELHAK